MRIDAHCHIDRFKDPAAIADRCETERILVVSVTNLPSHYDIGRKYVSHYRFVRLALGLHPLNAAKHHNEIALFRELASTTDYIGEVGLDFSPEGRSTQDLQMRVFDAVLDAIQGQRKFISIHSRGAEAEVLEMLKKHKVGPAVFHWYSGGVRTLTAAVEAGHYLSVNPAMTRSAKGQVLIGKVPMNRVLSETDGPYVKCGNRSAVPSDVDVVLGFLADLWGECVGEVERRIEANFLGLAPA